MKNDGEDAYVAIVEATRDTWVDHRDGVRSLMWMALAERRLLLKDVKRRVPEFEATYRREIGSYQRGFGQIVSLDQQLFDDGTMTRGDTVTRGFWADHDDE
jgi:hypothetical protein